MLCDKLLYHKLTTASTRSTKNTFINILLIIVLNLTAVHLQQQYHDTIIRTTKTREVLKYMNLSVNPCKDFYEFACGNWYRYQAPINEFEKVTPVELLSLKIKQDLQHLLHENITVDDSSAETKVKIFYKKCLSAHRNGGAQQIFFSTFIESNGGFPAVPGAQWQEENYNWQEVLANLRYHYNMDILISVDVDLNPSNRGYVPATNDIYLKEPSTIIPREVCNANVTQLFDFASYERLRLEMADNLTLWLTLDLSKAKELAGDLLKFETDLCLGMPPKEPRNNIANYTRRPPNEYTQRFNNMLDFNNFVSTAFGTKVFLSIIVISESYFEQLFNTINKFGKKVTANYIMYRALAALSLPQTNVPARRADYCLALMQRYYAKVVGLFYYRKFVNKSIKDDIVQMYEKLRHAFEQSLNQPWIDGGTSYVGIKKLNDIQLTFPSYEKQHLHINTSTDYWEILKQSMATVQPLQRERVLATEQHIVPPDEIESYDYRIKYRKLQKTIDIGWALLQKPFYHSLFGNSMHYAMIGQKIAAEIASAFDDIAWSSDGIKYPNWDNLTAKRYQKRFKCFRQQLNNYIFSSSPTVVNDTQLRSLIAHSAGLNLAFKAYLNWLEFMNPNNDFDKLIHETLPEFNFTNTQLFFIAFAQMHCGIEQNVEQSATILSPKHRNTMERYTVNGPLQNFEEFSREFRCAVGAEMNPADKCATY